MIFLIWKKPLINFKNRKMFPSPRVWALWLGLAAAFCALNAHAQQGYEIFEHKGKFGIKDAEGKTTANAKYQYLGWSRGLELITGGAIGYKDGKSWGLLSVKGKKITPARYYSLESVHSDLVIASLIGKYSNELLYGAINSRGEVVIDFKYHSVLRSSGLLIVSERRRGKSMHGLISEQGQVILELEHQKIEPFTASAFKFQDTNNYWGVVSHSGGILVKASLDSIGKLENGFHRIYQTGNVGLLDSTGALSLEPRYKVVVDPVTYTEFPTIEIRSPNDLVRTVQADSVEISTNGFTVVYRNGWVEILNEAGESINRQGKMLRYETFRENMLVWASHGVEVFDQEGNHWPGNSFKDVLADDHYLYARSEKGWYIFNAFRSKVSDRYFEEVKPGSSNLIPVKKNDYWGYLDHTGQTAVPFKFENASPFTGQLASVEYVGYQMLIDQFGNQVGEAAYDSIVINDDNTALVKIKHRTDILNQNGSALFQTYNSLKNHPSGYLEQTKEGHMGLILKNGRISFLPKYDAISDPMSNQFLAVRSNDHIGVSLMDGSWFMWPTAEYDEVMASTEGYWAIKKNGQWGMLNHRFQLVIANRYDSIRGFHQGLAAVQLGGKWGFINTKEQIVIQPNLDFVEDFDGSHAIVSRDGRFGLLSSEGKYVLDVVYDSLLRINGDMIHAVLDNKSGIFDSTGQQVLPVSFSKLFYNESGIIVKRREKFGVVDSSGKYVIPLKYDQIKCTDNGLFVCTTKP